MDSLKLVSNRKPADQLADIRAQMKALAEREEILRDMMIADPASRIGDEFQVAVYTARTEPVDTRKLKKELGLQFLRPFLKPADVVYVRIKRRKNEP